MAHKTLIDGAVYEIIGGKTLIDGAGYEISKGTTLVDGTAYEIPFAPTGPGITINFGGTVSGSEAFAYISFGRYADGSYLCITSDGKVRFDSPSGNLLETITDGAFFEQDIGSNIDCYVKSGGTFANATISVNGTIVASKRNGGVHYQYLTVGRATIALKVAGSGSFLAGTIEITEE